MRNEIGPNKEKLLMIKSLSLIDVPENKDERVGASYCLADILHKSVAPFGSFYPIPNLYNSVSNRPQGPRDYKVTAVDHPVNPQLANMMSK